eukprot:3890408-Amphidinium_carterae.1
MFLSHSGLSHDIAMQEDSTSLNNMRKHNFIVRDKVRVPQRVIRKEQSAQLERMTCQKVRFAICTAMSRLRPLATTIAVLCPMDFASHVRRISAACDALGDDAWT